MSELPTLLFLIGGGALVAWLLVLTAVLVATRPRTVAPDPPTDALGTLRPAVVNLLTHRWRCTPDAVAATMVDLMARGILGVRRDGPRTSIEIRQPTPPNLTRYERRLIGRLRALAEDDLVSLAWWPFLSRRAAARWFARFAAEVAADARARDVARTGVDTDFLSATALVPGLTLGAWTYVTVPTDPLFSALAVCVAVVLVLHQLAVRTRERHRPTPAGRSAAAHWLGVRDHLAAAGLDPALGTADSRIGYAVALGVAPALSERLAFAPTRTREVRLADRTLRVRFPDRLRFCWGWGALGVAAAGTGALLTAVVTAGLVRGYAAWLPAVGWLAALVLGAAGLALLGLAALDVAGTRQRSGTVVLLEEYGDRYVLAVTDGDRDAVDAWILPGQLRDGLAAGSRVEVRVRRCTGLVSRLELAAEPEPAAEAATT